MTEECQNSALQSSDERVVRKNIARLFSEITRPRFDHPTFSPLEAYTLLFRKILDVSIQKRIVRQFKYVQPAIRGSIYVFRDERDPPHVIKIGATRQSVNRRIAQWRDDLGATKNEVTALFSCPSDSIFLAEKVLHSLFFCEWMPKRINRKTGRRVVEYFYIPNRNRLRFLCIYVANYVTWFVHRNRQN